jgi:3-hydroxybutyryl-CoA dehydrogenase
LPETVAIIGAGPLGRSLALRAARAGFRVLLEDVMPSNLRHARERIRSELSADALMGVAFVSTVEDAVRSADLIIDCVPDELESKLEILWLLDRMAPPHAVFATPTTNLSIADLASCTYRPGQCVAIAAEPDALAEAAGPGIAIRTTSATLPETVALLDRFWRALGLTPAFDSASDPPQ